MMNQLEVLKLTVYLLMMMFQRLYYLMSNDISIPVASARDPTQEYQSPTSSELTETPEESQDEIQALSPSNIQAEELSFDTIEAAAAAAVLPSSNEAVAHDEPTRSPEAYYIPADDDVSEVVLTTEASVDPGTDERQQIYRLIDSDTRELL